MQLLPCIETKTVNAGFMGINVAKCAELYMDVARR